MKGENPSGDRRGRQQTIGVVTRNWQAEVETAQTYRDQAERERDERRKGVLLRMAEAEERHAQRWEKKLKDLGAEPPVFKDTIARRLNRWWNKIAGADIAIRRMEATEERQEAQFHDQTQRALANEQDVHEFLRQSALEEKAHARALSAMAPPAGPRTALDKILKRERWHGRGGSWVADAIDGAKRTGPVRASVSKSMDCCHVVCDLHCDRRFCSNHSILFLRWHDCGSRFLRH